MDHVEPVKEVVEQVNEFLKFNKKTNSTIEDSIHAVEYINKLRVKNGLKPIKWDERAYKLAMYRAKDMVNKKYFSHWSPSGENVYTLRTKFGFAPNERLCECIFMKPPSYEAYDAYVRHGNVSFDVYYLGIEEEAVDGWMESPLHHYILMHPELEGCAVACYKACCVFVGYMK